MLDILDGQMVEKIALLPRGGGPTGSIVDELASPSPARRSPPTGFATVNGARRLTPSWDGF